MPLYTDQTGRQIALESPPARIVSIVPSQTELLHALGLEEEVIGITKFCVHPDQWFRNKTRIGGTKTVHIEAVRKLQPDLILANKEENVKEQVEELSKDFPVWISDVNILDDACGMIISVGDMTNRAQHAREMVVRIRDAFETLERSIDRNNLIRTAYFIWRDPYMSVGHDTFIHDMLTRCGFENIFAHESRYPETTTDQLAIANCQLLLLSSEPYPFRQKHIDELQPHLPSTKILLADGEMFSWYGSRLLEAPKYFMQLREMVGNL